MKKIIILLCLLLIPIGEGSISGTLIKAPSTVQLILTLNPKVDPEIATIHAKYIDVFSRKWKVDRRRVISITEVESGFNGLAESNKGCVGAMQVNPQAHQDKIIKRGIKKRSELFHLSNNYDLGCEILSECKSATLENTLYKYYGATNNKYVLKVKNNLKKI